MPPLSLSLFLHRTCLPFLVPGDALQRRLLKKNNHVSILELRGNQWGTVIMSQLQIGSHTVPSVQSTVDLLDLF